MEGGETPVVLTSGPSPRVPIAVWCCQQKMQKSSLPTEQMILSVLQNYNWKRIQGKEASMLFSFLRLQGGREEYGWERKCLHLSVQDPNRQPTSQLYQLFQDQAQSWLHWAVADILPKPLMFARRGEWQMPLSWDMMKDMSQKKWEENWH